VSFVHRSDLILGGVRSGKSREALRVAALLPPGSRGCFLATAQALDADMQARIARHQEERPQGWTTIEEPYDVAGACERLAGRCDVVVLDCLTLWVSNLLLRGDKDGAILDAADTLARVPGFAASASSSSPTRSARACTLQRKSGCASGMCWAR
jgi:Adenosyl cobinamide kinase/adenosyl cobinamide phosphate guanylyltransferase